MAAAPQSIAKEQPRLQSQLGLIDSNIQGAWEAVSRLRSAYHRIAAPKPEGVGKAEAAAPTPSAVESRLDASIQNLNELQKSLHDLASEFDAMV